jgi:hypothetical protein
MDRSRRLPLLVAAAPLLLGVSSFVACSGERTGGSDSLRREFPTRASEALVSTRAFEATPEGAYRARASHGFDVTLPSRGHEPIVFEMASGQVIRVREDHAGGAATRVESAVRYDRAAGSSYWSLRDRGVEEWIALEPDALVAGAPAVTWSVEGGRFAEIEDVIAVVDEDGRAMLRVEAPKAYGVDGREIDVDLHLVGDRLALNVDADGERVLVDPFWFDAGDMNVARSGHVALLLQNGLVLVTGGLDDAGFRTASTEVYNPANHVWLARDPMPLQIDRFAAALLPDGDVFVSGGFAGDPVVSCRRYDVLLDDWSNVPGGMTTGRMEHTATVLLDGRIFIHGGSFNSSGEIYDPGDGTFTVTAGGTTSRANHTATLLPDGRVLLAGGGSFEGTSLVEIFDPAQGTYDTVASLNEGRLRFGAVLLPDGRVLVSGGGSFDMASAEIYDPADDSWTFVAPMNTARTRHTLTPLPDGRILAAGGSQDLSGITETASAEIYDPIGDTWTPVDALAESRHTHTATPLPDGTILATGGVFSSSSRRGSGERFTILNDLGEFCQFGFECASGFCTDFNCCDALCDGECQTCDNEGSGICIDVPDDEACAGGTCQGGTCVPDGLPLGSPCVDGSECDSEICQNDVCCDTFCFGDCVACSEAAGAEQDGTCGPTAGLSCVNNFNCAEVDICSDQGLCLADPAEEICPITECLENNFCGKGTCFETPVDDGTLCSNGGTCQGGICIPPDPLENGETCTNGIQCLSGECWDEVCCDTACFGQCQACAIATGADEDGTCAPVNDGDSCGKGGTCLDGECANLLPDGESCEDGAECNSGNCVDDVCCDTTCSGLCVACSESAGGQEDGVCVELEDGAACGQGGTCEAGECDTLLPNGEACEQEDECESDYCVDDVCCNTPCAGECTACDGAQPGTCQPVEDGTACEGGTCGDGLCVLDSPKELGEPCEAAEECGSGQCVDSVCCDSACDGECDACSTAQGAAEDGTCGNAADRGCDDDNACTETDTCQDRTCVGGDPVECTPGACQVSSSCAENTGACVAVSLPDGAPCEGGVCIAGACQTDPDVGSLSGSGTGNPSGAGPGGTGNGSGPSGTASGPSGGTGAGAGNGSGDDGEDGAADGESSDGCSVARRDGGLPRDLGWLAIAALIGVRWRRSRRRDAQDGEGRRAEP